ncbi:MAG: type II toxin-antitoxin system RelE/ParE family toxin [Devosia sp.]|jgi:plasmid stabilization system protein ParE
MRVTITAAARADLEEIGDFIAEDSPLRADSFGQELLDRCFGLVEHPLRYPIATKWLGREIRRCPHGRYLIFYSVAGDAIEINHIVHSARDYVRLLFPDT